VGTAALSTIGIVLTGWAEINEGKVALRGDQLDAGARFRNSYSVLIVFSDGLAEEAAIRGILQVRLRAYAGDVGSQCMAGLLLIAVHVFDKSMLYEWAFVVITAVLCGMLASKFHSTAIPAFVHGTSNAVVAMVVMAGRAP
jgi:membrane protease YdiL (CAAX protease family)